MIDINQPVPQGEDVVIPEGGDIHLGTYEEFNEKAALGLLTGVNPADYKQFLPKEPADKPKRDSKGHFVR